MPYSFSSRISLKFLKKSAKSQKNAFSQRPRAVNMVYQLPAISNLPYTLFLILNENLIPTYQYSAGILRANFHKNYLNDALLHLKKKSKDSVKNNVIYLGPRTLFNSDPLQ